LYKKLFFIFILLQSLLLSNDIEQSKLLFKQERDTKDKLEVLAQEIKYQEIMFNKTKNDLIEVSNNILKNKDKLKQFKLDILNLEKKLKEIKKDIVNTENKIISEITNRYSASLGLSLAKQATSDEIIDKEIYTLLMKFTKVNIKKLNELYQELNVSDNENILKILKYNKFIKSQEQKKIKYNKIKDRKLRIIDTLSKDYKKYKDELIDIIAKQNELGIVLEDLNIIKTIDENSLNIDEQEVSERQNVDIAKYNGYKTIAPLQAYTIVKKFGLYKDKIYNTTMFNKSISMKHSNSNLNIYNILNGKIIYIKKDSGVLENTIIIEHKNKVHTVYTNVDSINDNLSIGKRVRKGSIIGMVSDTLIFQVTQENKYIDPEELFE